MAATVQSQLLPAAQGSPDGSCCSTLKAAEHRRHLRRTQTTLLLVCVGVCASAAVILFLLASPQGPRECAGSIRHPQQPQQAASSLGPTTDAPMLPLPPFTPTCFVRNLGGDTGKFGLPVLSCRMDARCTVHDPSCCAYLHYEMLTFFHRFLASKCLQHEYLLAHGTALGAVRDQTILPHTQDLDLAVTPFLLQFLELNSTREELWRHGYAVFLGETGTFWKFHPHIHHPKPEFRAAFRAMGEPYDAWQARTKGKMAVYLDLWPMWQVPLDLQDCTREKPSYKTPQLEVPWDDQPALWDGQHIDTCSPRFAPVQDSNSSVASVGTKVCSMAVRLPWDLRGGGAPARIANETFAVPANYDQVFKTTYGGNWRVPDTKNHGGWPQTKEGSKLVGALRRKLSLTAWGGNMSLADRGKQCRQEFYY